MQIRWVSDGEMNYECMRCGYKYEGPEEPRNEPRERTCPKCGSNSVRIHRPKEK